jgi:manganese oxidase
MPATPATPRRGRALRTANLLASILVLTLLSACNPASGEMSEWDAPRVIEVAMLDANGDFRFSDERIEARRGDVIRFVQEGDMPHNVQFVRNSSPDGVELGDAWTGPYLNKKGEVYELHIDERFADGEYEFVCTPHVGFEMRGTLVVSGGNVEAAEPGSSRTAHERPEVIGEKGLQELEYTVASDGAKEFHLTAERIRWETREGSLADAMAYNRMIPGPLIRVTEGDRVRITVENRLDEPHTTHWHGLFVPNDMDGVPGISQDPIEPGDSFVYEFVADPAGTRLYHSHFNAMSQEAAGLYGMFVIEERDPPASRQVDREEQWILGDGPLGYVINGKEFPLTEPIEMKLGERIKLRMANLGGMYHPMHMHGGFFTVVAKDGFALEVPQKMNTLSLAPGETYDVILDPQFGGTWIWHCHVLSHATGPRDADGNETAAGMIGVVVVDDGETVLADMSNHTHH